MSRYAYCLTFVGFILVFSRPAILQAQQYDLFEVSNDELYWSCTYQFPSSADSLRGAIVQMLKSKHFTYNVYRSVTGYHGEIRHYTANGKKYGRKYASTPVIYWDGEWTGKFTLEILDNAYRVVVYALYAQPATTAGFRSQTKKIKHGRLIRLVSNNKGHFIKHELPNLALMSLGLKDQFDIRNTTLPPGR